MLVRIELINFAFSFQLVTGWLWLQFLKQLTDNYSWEWHCTLAKSGWKANVILGITWTSTSLTANGCGWSSRNLLIMLHSIVLWLTSNLPISMTFSALTNCIRNRISWTSSALPIILWRGCFMLTYIFSNRPHLLWFSLYNKPTRDFKRKQKADESWAGGICNYAGREWFIGFSRIFLTSQVFICDWVNSINFLLKINLWIEISLLHSLCFCEHFKYFYSLGLV